MKHNYSRLSAIIAGVLAFAFTAQVIAQVAPQQQSSNIVTYQGPQGRAGTYVEQINNSQNDIRFRICEGGPNACRDIAINVDGQRRSSFSLDDLNDMSSRQMLYAGGKTAEDAAVGIVTMIGAWKLVLRPVGRLISGSWNIVKGVRRMLGAVATLHIVGIPLGVYYAPETTTDIVLFEFDHTIGFVLPAAVWLYSYRNSLQNGNRPTLQQVGQGAQNLLNSATERTGVLPSVDQMTGLVTAGRNLPAQFTQNTFINNYLNPVENWQSSQVMSDAEKEARTRGIRTVTVADAALFARYLENGLERNYHMR